MNHDRYIADLVEKFLDGRTTNSEERELYVWFRTHDIPEEWKPLKSMFAWYEAGMPEEAVTEVAEQKPIMPQTKVISLRRWFQVVGSCAAVITIVVFLFNGYDISGVQEQGSHVENIATVATIDDDLMHRADHIEQQAYELLAWAEMNNL